MTMEVEVNSKGRWDPKDADEWYRRNRELVIVPAVEVPAAIVPVVPVGTDVDPDAFIPRKRDYGSN